MCILRPNTCLLLVPHNNIESEAHHFSSINIPPRPENPPLAALSWHFPREYKMCASQAISIAFPFFVRRRDKNIVSQSCLDI